MNSPITEAEYRLRLEALCVRGGRHAFPRRERDRWILLHALSLRFREGESIEEREASARIAVWLQETGSTLDIDPVALRRARVDEGFLARQRDGTGYKRSAAFAGRIAFDPVIDALDPDQIVEESRFEAAERRRKYHEQRSPGPPSDGE